MTSPGSFFERVDALAERIGHNTRTGSVVVDQIYAKYQHERLDLRHPRGGQAHYLSAPLMANASKYLQEVADRLHEEGPNRPMADAMENLSGEVGRLAPIDFNNLRRSGNPRVLDGEQPVYDRPAEQRRLTQQELDDLRRNRGY